MKLKIADVKKLRPRVQIDWLKDNAFCGILMYIFWIDRAKSGKYEPNCLINLIAKS